MSEDPISASVIAALDCSRDRFHALVASLSSAEWDLPSRNPAWTNGQVVYHILFAFTLIPSLFWLITFWSRLPDPYSERFARLLDWTTPLFNRVNAFGPKAQAALLGRRRAVPIFDRVHRSLVRKAGSIAGERWQLGMHYPTRWDTSFGDFMTFETLFRYPNVHLEKHLKQLTAGEGRGGG